MPDIVLPQATMGGTPEQSIQNLYDVVIRFRKELEYLLANLDEKNVLKAKSVIADWVYAGTVEANKITTVNATITNAQIGSLEANKITTVNAKIATAQIVDLVVGGNVTMGADATISWAKVSNQPSIPSQYTDTLALAAWVASGYKTYIDANGVYTGTLTANQVNAVAINADSITSGTITGRTIKTAATGKRLEMSLSDYSGYLSFFDVNNVEIGWFRVNSSNVMSLKNQGDLEIYAAAGNMYMNTLYNTQLAQGGNIYIGACYGVGYTNYKTYFSGNIDFSGAESIAGFTCKFA